MKSTSHNFTLVEILMVIIIIAVLMGMLFPAITGVREQAKKTQAKAEMKSLEIAIKQYESTYGVLPVASAGSDVALSTAEYEKLISFLSQTGTDQDQGNVRKIRMLDVDVPGEYKDPWKEEHNKNYRVALDANYDGEINETVIYGMADNVPKSVVIWTAGPDGKDSGTDGNDDNQDNLYSVDSNWTPSGHELK